jgi:ABC-type bacteriocin/lantibiotic exporter with double-glycine peptidase domain
VSQELRNAVFASVAQKAIRKVACSVYEHLLKLDLSFHLSRQTGGLTRAIDRGTKGISFLLTSMVFHIVPTALEISLVCGILTYQYGWQFAAITGATMTAYSAFTIMTTSWRTKFRKQANAADNKAATVAVDSMINYEAVKVSCSLIFFNTLLTSTVLQQRKVRGRSLRQGAERLRKGLDQSRYLPRLPQLWPKHHLFFRSHSHDVPRSEWRRNRPTNSR